MKKLAVLIVLGMVSYGWTDFAWLLQKKGTDGTDISHWLPNFQSGGGQRRIDQLAAINDGTYDLVVATSRAKYFEIVHTVFAAARAERAEKEVARQNLVSGMKDKILDSKVLTNDEEKELIKLLK